MPKAFYEKKPRCKYVHEGHYECHEQHEPSEQVERPGYNIPTIVTVLIDIICCE